MGIHYCEWECTTEIVFSPSTGAGSERPRTGTRLGDLMAVRKDKAELLNPMVGVLSEWGEEEVIHCALHFSQPES